MRGNSDEKPWGEAQWEEFMMRSEMRAAKYHELMETFLDHPDRDDIIDHEMGWDEPVEYEEGWSEEAMDEVFAEAQAEVAATPPEEFAAERRREKRDLEAIPAYAAAHDFGLRLHDALKPLAEKFYEKYGGAEPDGRDPLHENLVTALRNCFVIAVKIVGGHSMGYEDDVVGANIVKCKQSRDAAQATLDALQVVQAHGALPAGLAASLIEENRRVCALVEARIAELRARVWWE